MNYGELKAALRAEINRKDITDALAAGFIQRAQDRLERWPQVDPLKWAPRPSFMQKLVTFELEEDSATPGVFTVPSDYLELINLYSGTVELERVDMSRFIRVPAAEVGTPRYFVQTGHTIRMRPLPEEGTEFYLHYYGTEPVLDNDLDENAWTIAAVDALLYGAAENACRHYEDERLDSYKVDFLRALGDIQDQSLSEDFSGPMTIQPAYQFDVD